MKRFFNYLSGVKFKNGKTNYTYPRRITKFKRWTRQFENRKKKRNSRKNQSFGDLSENSEYDEAKNEQEIMESRILEIETMLKKVKVINEGELSTKIIHVGSKVKLEDKTFDETVEYRIVGSSEADPREGRISDESPVGAALLGHKAGQTINVETPGGISTYKILEISK